jgi:hypothetical protein
MTLWIILALFRIFAGQVMEKVLESLERGFFKVGSGNASLPPVHQDACQLNPISLSEFQSILRLLMIF